MSLGALGLGVLRELGSERLLPFPLPFVCGLDVDE